MKVAFRLVNEKARVGLATAMVVAVATAVADPAAAGGLDGPPGFEDLPFGPVTLRFPSAMMDQSGYSVNKDAGFISMILLLPDFEAKDTSNAAEFERKGYGRMIHVFLEYPSHMRSNHDYLYGLHGPFYIDPATGHPDPHVHELPSEVTGFRKIEKGWGGTLYILTADEDFFVECFGMTTEPSPACQYDNTIWGSVKIHLAFSTDYLPGAVKVVNDTMSFLQTSVVPASHGKTE